MKIFVVYDKKLDLITEIYQDVNLSGVVRNIQAMVNEDFINKKFARIYHWEDSVLYELSGDVKNGFKVTGNYELNNITQLKKSKDEKQDVTIKKADILEDSLKYEPKN